MRRQYEDPPVLRIVKPRPRGRMADVWVEPAQGRRFPLPPPPSGETPSSPAASGEDSERVSSTDIIFDLAPFETAPEERTPVTVHSPWHRNIPPPLPVVGGEDDPKH